MDCTNLELAKICNDLARQLTAKKLMFASAESCTGGLISATCTAQPGSSSWFSHSIVSYSNQAKINLLKVAPQLIKQYGAVSEQVAQAMVCGLVADNKQLVGVAVTGIAGPSGGSSLKPVGTVCFAFAINQQVFVKTQQFSGDRDNIRYQTVKYALVKMVKLIGLKQL